MSRWPQLLLDNVSPMQRATVGDQQLLKRYLSKSDKLVHTCDPERGGTPLVDKPHGINPVLARLSLANRLRELTLSGNRLTDANLRALCGAMRLNDRARLTLLCLDVPTTLDPLLLPRTPCANFAVRFRAEQLKAAIKSLADALPAATQLRRVDVLQTGFCRRRRLRTCGQGGGVRGAGGWCRGQPAARRQCGPRGQLADNLATFIPRDATRPRTPGMEDWGRRTASRMTLTRRRAAARLRPRYGGVPCSTTRTTMAASRYAAAGDGPRPRSRSCQRSAMPT